MKRKYFMAGIVLGMIVFTASMSVLADSNDVMKENEFYLPEERLIRNEEGRIVGIDVTYEDTVDEYNEVIDFEQLMTMPQFKEYEKLGLSYDESSKKAYFSGMEVYYLYDKYEKHSFLQCWPKIDEGKADTEGISLTAVRDEEYKLQYFMFTRFQYLDEDIFMDDDVYSWSQDENSDDDYGTDDSMASTAIIGGADEPTYIYLPEKQNNVERVWDCTTVNSEDSNTKNNIINYVDDMIIKSQTGSLTFQNRNDFDIEVHLMEKNERGDGFETLKIEAGGIVTLNEVDTDIECIVGIHANVKEGIEIKLFVYDGNRADLY